MATYGDYTLRDLIDKILGNRPNIALLEQPPEETSDATVSVRVNINGSYGRLQKKETDGTWTNVGSIVTSSFSTYLSIPLSGIATTSVCRVLVIPVGGSFDSALASDEFTVTRTSAQTMSAKQDMSGTVEKTDLEADSMDVVEDTPKAKTTTTKK